MFCTLNSGQPQKTAGFRAVFISAVLEILPCINIEIEKSSFHEGICYLKESVI